MLLVDAYNVLHVVGVLPPHLAGLDTEGLAAAIASSRFRRQRATLVCDGRGDEAAPASVAGVRIRYAGLREAGRTADDLIIALIDRSSHPRRLLVVSSDRAILRAARRRRCRTLTSEEFLRRIAEDLEAPAPSAPPRVPASLSRPEIDEWTEAFDIDPDRPVEPQIDRAGPAVPAAAPPPAPASAPPADPQAARRLEEARAEALARTLPPSLIAEAEALLQELEAEPPAPEPAPPAPPELPSATPDSTPPPSAPAAPDYGAALPEELIAEAEALLDEPHADAPPEPASADAEREQTDRPAADTAPRGPAALLPDELVDEAQALADASRAAPPRPGTYDSEVRSTPQPVDSTVPPEIIEEAERLLREDEDSRG